MGKTTKSSIAFNVVKKTPYDLKKTTKGGKKEWPKWRNFSFKGKCPEFDCLKELASQMGDDKFKESFKSYQHSNLITYKEEEFDSYESARFCFKCTEELMNVIIDFFNEGGYTCEVSEVNFPKKEEEKSEINA